MPQESHPRFPTGEVTSLLRDLRSERRDPRFVEAELFSVLYATLRRMAAAHLRKERAQHTLQPTALVHEAYLRLVAQSAQNWENRAHFLATSARVMRQILIDHARKRLTDKRGGRDNHVSVEESDLPALERPEDFLRLDEALSQLEQLDIRQARIVEMRFFAGLSEEEIANLLGVSVRTVKRDWRIARAWLFLQLKK